MSLLGKPPKIGLELLPSVLGSNSTNCNIGIFEAHFLKGLLATLKMPNRDTLFSCAFFDGLSKFQHLLVAHYGVNVHFKEVLNVVFIDVLDIALYVIGKA